MAGVMLRLIKTNIVIVVALVVSLALHIFLVYAIVFKNEENTNRGEPIEVSVIPKEKKEDADIPPLTPAPVPDFIPPPPDAETTMDEDVNTSPNAEMNEEIQLPKQPVVPDVAEEDIETDVDVDTYIEDRKQLADARDIIERIARQKPPEKPGEDSASYSVFEERYASYFTKFKARVYQVWKYPNDAIAKGQTGVVNVEFDILKDGRIVNVRLKQSSGYPTLDREVMRVLKTMGTVPLPQSYNLEQLNVDDAYFIYTLDGTLDRLLR